jgi:molybdopterin molybdotransferase
MADFERRDADWLSFEEALRRVLAAAPPLPPRSLPLLEAAGLALAEELRSTLTLPPGPTSHMDGYAIRAADSRTAAEDDAPRFRVTGTSRPGRPSADLLAVGAAARIMTGALLPEGADAVVPVEETDREEGEAGWVRIFPKGRGESQGERGKAGGAAWTDIVPGQHVRARGEEVAEGELIGSPGDALHFGRLALLAATGLAAVPVHPAPRVALLVTGDELVPAGDPEALWGGVRRVDILSPSLPLLFRAAGADSLPPVRVGDDPDALRAAMVSAADAADLVVTTGGASMGEADLVKRILDGLGFQLDFWRIRMRPGSPVSLGRLLREGRDPVPVLSLPGNPTSAIVTCAAFALPAIRSLGGHRCRTLRRLSAKARDPFPGPERLTRLFRVRLEREADGGWGARSAGAQGSGAIRALAEAEALVLLPEGAPAPGPGDPVEVLILPQGGWEAER